jgi:hypothetical protein
MRPFFHALLLLLAALAWAVAASNTATQSATSSSAPTLSSAPTFTDTSTTTRSADTFTATFSSAPSLTSSFSSAPSLTATRSASSTPNGFCVAAASGDTLSSSSAGALAATTEPLFPLTCFIGKVLNTTYSPFASTALAPTAVWPTSSLSFRLCAAATRMDVNGGGLVREYFGFKDVATARATFAGGLATNAYTDLIICTAERCNSPAADPCATARGALPALGSGVCGGATAAGPPAAATAPFPCWSNLERSDGRTPTLQVLSTTNNSACFAFTTVCRNDTSVWLNPCSGQRNGTAVRVYGDVASLQAYIGATAVTDLINNYVKPSYIGALTPFTYRWRTLADAVTFCTTAGCNAPASDACALSATAADAFVTVFNIPAAGFVSAWLSQPTQAALSTALNFAAQGICATCTITLKSAVNTASGAALISARRLQGTSAHFTFSVTGGSSASLAAVTAAACTPNSNFLAALQRALAMAGGGLFAGATVGPGACAAPAAPEGEVLGGIGGQIGIGLAVGALLAYIVWRCIVGCERNRRREQERLPAHRRGSATGTEYRTDIKGVGFATADVAKDVQDTIRCFCVDLPRPVAECLCFCCMDPNPTTELRGPRPPMGFALRSPLPTAELPPPPPPPPPPPSPPPSATGYPRLPSPNAGAGSRAGSPLMPSPGAGAGSRAGSPFARPPLPPQAAPAEWGGAAEALAPPPLSTPPQLQPPPQPTPPQASTYARFRDALPEAAYVAPPPPEPAPAPEAAAPSPPPASPPASGAAPGSGRSASRRRSLSPLRPDGTWRRGAEGSPVTDQLIADFRRSCLAGDTTAVAAALKRVPMLAALPHGRTGEVPLFAAVAAKNLPLVKLLVEAGADAGARDARGRTPADVAEGDGAASMARWLRQAQADAAIAAAAEGGAQMYQPM